MRPDEYTTAALLLTPLLHDVAAAHWAPLAIREAAARLPPLLDGGNDAMIEECLTPFDRSHFPLTRVSTIDGVVDERDQAFSGVARAVRAAVVWRTRLWVQDAYEAAVRVATLTARGIS